MANYSFTSDSSFCSPAKPIKNETRHSTRDYLDRASQLNQLKEIDADLKKYFASGGITNLASQPNIGDLSNLSICSSNYDMTINNDTIDTPNNGKLTSNDHKNVIDNAQTILKKDINSIQSEPPFYSILNSRVYLPERKPVDTKVYFTSLTEQSKLSLILDILYEDQIKRSIALDILKKYLSFVNESSTVLSFNILYQIFQSLVSNRKWLETLANQFSISNTYLDIENDYLRTDDVITFQKDQTIELSSVNMDGLWQVLLSQSFLNDKYFTTNQISFIVCIAILLTSDKNLNKFNLHNTIWLRQFISHTLSLCLELNFEVLIKSLFSNVLHHHTRVYICSSLPVTSERGRTRVLQIMLACQIICENKENIAGDTDQIVFKYAPQAVFDMLESYLSDKDFDQKCDIYLLYSKLQAIFYLINPFSFIDWNSTNWQRLLEYLTKMCSVFKKYTLNVDGCKVLMECQYLLSLVKMKNENLMKSNDAI